MVLTLLTVGCITHSDKIDDYIEAQRTQASISPALLLACGAGGGKKKKKDLTS